MTFKEAQEKFSTIIASITLSMTSSELLLKQEELMKLQSSLPASEEFDAISTAIAKTISELTGIITLEVLKSLMSRDAALKESSDLLTEVAKKADSDASKLKFEKPKLVLYALTDSVTKLKEIRDAAKSGGIVDAASKAEALLVLLQQVQQSIKTW